MIGIIDNGQLVCPVVWPDVLLRLFVIGYTIQGGKLIDEQGVVVQDIPADEPTEALTLPDGLVVLPVVEIPAEIGPGQMSGGWEFVALADRIEHRESVMDIPPAPPAPLRTILTPYEFASRFTLAETADMITLTDTDPMAKAIQKRFDVAQQIDLTLPDVAQGLAYFVSKGALTAERVQQIIAPEA